MKKGLLDYAKTNPCTEAPAPPPKIRDVIEDETRAAELMQKIGDDIRQAAPPSNVLEDALSLIGILTHNDEWAERLKKKASTLYGVENLDGLFPVPEADRLKEKRRQYQEKTIRALTRSANACAALEKELRAAIQTAGNVLPDAEVWENDEPTGKDVDAIDIPY